MVLEALHKLVDVNGRSERRQHALYEYFIGRSINITNKSSCLKAKIFAPGEWYSCRGLAVEANSGVLTLGFKRG